jgi:hypothetical protein
MIASSSQKVNDRPERETNLASRSPGESGPAGVSDPDLTTSDKTARIKTMTKFGAAAVNA